MSQPRKPRPRSVEHQEAAECAAYNRGYADATAGHLPQHQPHDTPDRAVITHKDGDPRNNELDNLELGDSSD